MFRKSQSGLLLGNIWKNFMAPLTCWTQEALPVALLAFPEVCLWFPFPFSPGWLALHTSEIDRGTWGCPRGRSVLEVALVGWLPNSMLSEVSLW